MHEVGGGMNYADFIYFTLAYVENTTDMSLRYWFRVLDLDGDGALDLDLLHHWYELQVKAHRRSPQANHANASVASIDGSCSMKTMKMMPGAMRQPEQDQSLVNTSQFMAHSLDAMFADVYSIHRSSSSSLSGTEKRTLSREDVLSATRGAVVAIFEILTNANKFAHYYHSGGGSSAKVGSK
jgi:hypothetical protein